MVETHKRDEIVRTKILAEINDINKFIEGMSENDFYCDLKTQKARDSSLVYPFI